MNKVIIKMNKLKKMPAKLIFKKVYKKINKKFYLAYRKFMIKRTPIMLEDSFFCKFETKCKFLYDINNKSEYIPRIYELGLEEDIIKSSDKICNHVFNLLGSGDVKLGSSLPWNKDFKVNYEWNNQFYRDIKIVELNNNADVKIPWELSRFQHIFTLGKAYWISNNEKYAIEFSKEIEDWIVKNPIEMSVNWACTMDVSIRAVNWICGYFFFRRSKSIDDNFWILFNKWLFLHGRFIYKNLENGGEHTGNHYLSNLVGLIWIGVYFIKFNIEDNQNYNNPKEWLCFSLQEFEREMQKEVNEDGTNYETSSSYHRLVTEMFLLTTILCDKNNIHFTKVYMDKLEKMCEFIMNITKPNGMAPLIGDSDDGRLLVISKYSCWEKRDFRHILAIAGEYFNRDDFRSIGQNYKEDALWILGKYENINSQIELMPVSMAYENGGYYLLKNERIYCLIRCGELAFRGQGAHSHNDQLSIELNIDGEDFIIDPGTYVYTADYNMRNLYRSTNYHNTVLVNSLEQNSFEKFELFEMIEETFSKCEAYSKNVFTGLHYGYVKKCGVVHKRKVEMYENELIIYDRMINQYNDSIRKKVSVNEYIVNFIVDYGVYIIQTKDGVELVKNNKSILVKFKGKFDIKDTFISYGYGIKLNSKSIRIRLESSESIIRIILPERKV